MMHGSPGPGSPTGIVPPAAPGGRAALFLGARAVRDLLPLAACIEAVERALALLARGRLPAPVAVGHPAAGGGFHVKIASLPAPRPYFAAKVNGNFPGNPAGRGLPTIQGLVVLCDAETGSPLAVLDSGEVTAVRTGAVTAVAARHLARPDSAVATIVGCGVQGRVQLRAIVAALPLTRVFAVDLDPGRARTLAREAAAELGIEVRETGDLEAAVRASDVCVTCTPARHPVLRRAWVRPGAFVAAVGADSPDKQELEPALLAAARVVVDDHDQCAAIGELAHALRAGVLPPGERPAELGEVVAGIRPGRRAPDEVVVFDSTGTAVQDVAAAALAYERAVAAGRGRVLDLGE